MSENKTPLERAAEANYRDHVPGDAPSHWESSAHLPEFHQSWEQRTRPILSAATSDREGLARALHADDLKHRRAAVHWHDLDQAVRDWYQDQANAAAEWMTGEKT